MNHDIKLLFIHLFSWLYLTIFFNRKNYSLYKCCLCVSYANLLLYYDFYCCSF